MQRKVDFPKDGCVCVWCRLENMRDEMWGNMVEVVSSDMRVWNAPQKADILISELLGSFGDNELSPECLDGAQRFLKGQQLFLCSTVQHYCQVSIQLR